MEHNSRRVVLHHRPDHSAHVPQRGNGRNALVLPPNRVRQLGAPERNPFLHARLPRLRTLLDDVLPVGDVTTHTARAATLLALDATLGVPGTPQSGTGQTSLFTGENAARLHGRAR